MVGTGTFVAVGIFWVDVISASFCKDDRNSNLGKAEVIASEISTAALISSLFHCSSLCRCSFLHQLVCIGISIATDDDVADLALRGTAINIDICHRILYWYQWVLGIVFATQKYCLFCSDREKKDGTLRLLLLMGKLPGEYQQGSYAWGIVTCTVIDTVSIYRFLYAEMIPVGRIDEILIFLVTARKNGCYIMGIGYIYVIFKFDIAFCPEVNAQKNISL